MADKTLTLQWNQLLLDAIKFTKTSPPLAARAMAMLHTAMYDAWSVYDRCAISTVTAQYIKIPEKYCSKENTRKAFSYAAYRVLMHLFWLPLPPENKDMFTDFMCTCGYDPADNSFDINKPQGIGNLAAKMTIEYRAGDGSNPYGTLHVAAWSDYTNYKPVNSHDCVNDLSYWQPLQIESPPGTFTIQQFLTAHWGLVKPFSLLYNAQFRPGAPYKKEDPAFKLQTKEVIDISAGLTDEQKVIAEYWADGVGTYTPPGHWCEIAQFAAAKNNYRNSQCIKLFFALGNALFGAAIACWECKRYYNSVRPITAVRQLYKGMDIQAWAGPGKGTATIKGENWKPYIATPPFPEHVSGHSTFSRAAATVLIQFTERDEFGGCTVVAKGSSKIEPGKTPCKDHTLDWPTYNDAATQAGLSRLYGGIHFSKGNEEGQKLGRAIGVHAWEKALYYFNA